MERERPRLKAALFLCASAYGGSKLGAETLREMGFRHREYGVDPVLYEVWLVALCEVVAEYDPQFTRETEVAWEIVMRRGIKLLKEGHARNAS